MPNTIERRQFARFLLKPMYTPIAVRTLEEARFTREGHAYDISEGGVQFELDRPIEPGTPVALQITLPCHAEGRHHEDPGPGRAVFVTGNVVWIDDDGVPGGPVRMAAVFTAFSRAGDRERLLGQITTGRLARAA